MILGIGTDICSIERIAKIYNKHPKTFAKKICHESASINEVAKKWAATEALSKATSLGLAKTKFQNVSICHEPSGKPYFSINQTLEETIKQLFNVTHFKTHLSLSDDGIYVLAMVILEI